MLCSEQYGFLHYMTRDLVHFHYNWSCIILVQQTGDNRRGNYLKNPTMSVKTCQSIGLTGENY